MNVLPWLFEAFILMPLVQVARNLWRGLFWFWLDKGNSSLHLFCVQIFFVQLIILQIIQRTNELVPNYRTLRCRWVFMFLNVLFLIQPRHYQIFLKNNHIFIYGRFIQYTDVNEKIDTRAHRHIQIFLNIIGETVATEMLTFWMQTFFCELLN